MPKDLDNQKHAASAAPYKLGSRSCHGCYHRKVRCDRAVPCGQCESHGLTCVYPGRAPLVKDNDVDAPKKSTNLQSISSRLARVEDLLTRLVERTERLDFGDSGTARPFAGNVHRRGHERGQKESQQAHESQETRQQQQEQDHEQRQQSPQQSQPDQPAAESTWEILLNDGHDERALPFSGSPSVGNTPQSGTLHRGNDTGTAAKPLPFPFPHRTTPSSTPREKPDIHVGIPRPDTFDVSDVLALYPSTQLALQLWSVYVRAVDPVLKILHIPTVQTTVVATILDPTSASPSTLALTVAIYYAALTAEPTAFVPTEGEAHALLARCKTALDSLLTVAHLVARPDMPFLQALAIYVTCLRAHEVGRSVWVLNGLAIRLAQSMGLHRDGAHLRLRPFDTEMRLRLWWHLCVLDSRAPEDQGLQPTIAVTNWELRLPRNVNDAQLYPDMAMLPADVGDTWTDMSFFLMQTEACRSMHPILETQGRQAAAMVVKAMGPLHAGPGGLSPSGGGGTPMTTLAGITTTTTTTAEGGTTPIAVPSDPLTSIREKRKIIRDPARSVQARFSVSLDGLSSPATDLQRMAIQHMGTAVKKMEFVLQLREEIILQRRGGSGDVPIEKREPAILKPSFHLACAALDSSRALLHDSASTPFAWFFGTYTQWYALAYVLRCLCCRPREVVAETQAVAELAWALVDELFPSTLQLHGHDEEADDDGSIWSYLHRLRQQAAVVREEQAKLAVTGAVQAGDSTFAQQLSVPFEAPPPVDRPPGVSEGFFTGTDLGQDLDMPSTGQADQDMFSSLDLFMADIQFLPDWDTVINM
ncbi:hypothetical protein SCUCBS95973_006056 [Sporothrix curviconia]|uniref:Zn(2)-C6 fungal-type domain-containing protein n=1 Tax=Sporothrix curviconia TaxID=1260050 RepID=A0ABP0C1Y8_9PEZI